LKEKNIFQYFVDKLSLGLASLRIHIFFADPDPGSQNIANPKDPDSKHCEISAIASISSS